MALFSLLVKLGLDGADFQAGVKRAESTATAFGRNVVGSVKGQLAAAFSVAAVGAFAHSVVEAADRIGDLADQMSLSTDEVQKLDIAAKRSGVEIEAMGSMFLKVGEYRKKAGEGDVEAQQHLAKMGISLADIQNRSLSNKDIAEKIAGWYGETAKTAKDQADLVEIAGTKSEKLLSVLAAMHDLGPVKLFSDDDIAAISKFKDATDDLKRNLQVAAAPAVGWWANVMNDARKMQRDTPDATTVGTIVAALYNGFAGDPDGTKTAGMSKDEVRAEAAKQKAQREAAAEDLFEPKLSDATKSGNKPSLGGGPLRSIGGILFDRFDDANMQREAMKLSARTAAATEKTATALDAATRR